MKLGDYIFGIFTASVILISSCKNKDITPPLVINPSNNANGMVVSGDGYSNATILFNPSNSSGYYDTTLHTTALNILEDTGSLVIRLHFHFNGESYFIAQDTTPGPYNVSDTITIFNSVNNNTVIYRPAYTNDYLTVLTYDNAGGNIEGVFSGNYINNSNIGDTLKVSNGRFSVTRLPDVY